MCYNYFGWFCEKSFYNKSNCWNWKNYRNNENYKKTTNRF